MPRAFLAFAATACVALASGAVAQDLSDAEVLERFNLQKDAISATRSGLGTTRSIGGATRGVSLVTLEDVTTDAAAQPAAEDGVTVAGTPETVSAPTDPNQPIQVALFDPGLQVNIRVRFGFDSAAIDRTELPKLEQMCRVMTQTTDVERFRIIGHTDAAGTDAYNERLSMLRAEEVVRYLTDECGIEAARLEAVGLGKRFLYDEANPKADANRRVEFQVLG
jgi:OmpA-OmpF porin, OOP family